MNLSFLPPAQTCHLQEINKTGLYRMAGMIGGMACLAGVKSADIRFLSLLESNLSEFGYG